MKTNRIIDLINKYPKELKALIKDLYKKVNDTQVINWDEVKVTDKEFNKLIELMQLVNKGEDITFEIGYRYFRGNKLILEKGVFVPQYDTEQIVDLVKKKINEGNFIEIGPGTGAISISILNETKMNGIAIDINPKAVDLTKDNYEANKKTDKELVVINNDLFKYNFESKFDLIITNPPYIDYDDQYVDDWVKNNQPKEALYADDNGLSFYKFIFNKVDSILNTNGYIILEIGYDQGEIVKKLALEISEEVEVIKDYEQHDRFVVVKYNGR